MHTNTNTNTNTSANGNVKSQWRKKKNMWVFIFLWCSSSSLCNGVHPNQSCVSTKLNYALTYKIAVTRIHYTQDKYVLTHARTVREFCPVCVRQGEKKSNRNEAEEIVDTFYMIIFFVFFISIRADTWLHCIGTIAQHLKTASHGLEFKRIVSCRNR